MSGRALTVAEAALALLSSQVAVARLCAGGGAVAATLNDGVEEATLMRAMVVMRTGDAQPRPRQAMGSLRAVSIFTAVATDKACLSHALSELADKIRRAGMSIVARTL